MAGKTKGGVKNKAKANQQKAAEPAAETGCRACNFTGETCRKCGEPIVGCACKSFEPVACKACGKPDEAIVATELSAEQIDAAAVVAEPADDADDQGLAAEETEATYPADAAQEHADQMVAEQDAAAGPPFGAPVLQGETVPAMAAAVAQNGGGDHELEALVAESVKRRLERIKSGNRRRHHTKQLTIRVLTGIIRAGEAAAQGGADGFFGRWCRNDLMAWEALMDAAEWAQEELNAREFRRLKRESIAAVATAAAV